ncbi:S-layer homology domain-containing protein [Anaerotignum lactatifermentans]|uniref:S-layer homology domain-containing protein n=1 Tax=Anaerotignum lactatifermentans TaxID=160404 RepID=A0ABS2G7Q5_9FIRM|nr:S-layer homology domain-containing protein [Anaerotignum lactatifermentans]MBM6829157.1 S-layer homology domain-containing protein [Anaerotignum lactatifermentans]MBM6877235.1 S-layer homology domain-containing protein [Anaerotignum lactatifermentans]MBM6950608.1 S-layer homology domain-containing protein [Anaerotignum lactatifermentans]
MKRKLSLALAVILAAGTMPATAMAATFKDINELPWASSSITAAADRNLISGYEDGTFRAKNNVTYTECMVMLYNVLSKTNSLQTMDTSAMAGYYSTFSSMGIPTWAQASVIYGLSTNVLYLSDLTKFYDDGVARAATREDVAIFFGRALETKYDLLKTPTVIYNDQWKISDTGASYIDLLSRLGIFSGDDNKNFNPDAPITRGEMAVVMNKTYELLDGNNTGNQGEITKLVNNSGDYYELTIQMDNGEERKFIAMNDRTKVYNKDGSAEISLSRFSKGDRVSIVYTETSLDAIYLLDEEANSQTKYDITGYIMRLENSLLRLENENTGERQDYTVGGSCIYYLDGKKVSRSEFTSAVENNSDKYLYAGLMISTKTVKHEKVGNVEETTVDEIYLTISDTYTAYGEVTTIGDSYVSFQSEGGASRTFNFANNCQFYLGEEKSTIKELKEFAETGTIYVKITADLDEKVTKVVLSEDTFNENLKQTGTTYRLEGLSEKRMTVTSGGKTTEYTFGSSNPLENITFYTWDSDNKDWNDVKFASAQDYYEDKCYDAEKKKDETVYCRIYFNSGGKINEIYISDKSSAWTDSDMDTTERKGTVASLINGVLKFKTSSTEYTMLSRYNVENSDGSVENELNITSAITSSLTVFEKMANSPDVTLYAEIKADADKKVTEVKEAYLTYAKGTIVEYEPDKSMDERYITIETSDGAQLKLHVVARPKTGSDDYTYEDIASTGYVGSTVELEFNNSGYVSKITVDESTVQGAGKRISGVAVSADNGLKLKGDDTVYDWMSSVIITSSSFDSDQLYRLKEMIEDKDVDVYIKAKLTEKSRVEEVEVTIQGAEGILKEYDDSDHTVRIQTADGNTFTFNVLRKPTCDISGVTLEDLDEDWNGKEIKLVFDDDGYVEAFRD